MWTRIQFAGWMFLQAQFLEHNVGKIIYCLFSTEQARVYYLMNIHYIVHNRCPPWPEHSEKPTFGISQQGQNCPFKNGEKYRGDSSECALRFSPLTSRKFKSLDGLQGRQNTFFCPKTDLWKCTARAPLSGKIRGKQGKLTDAQSYPKTPLTGAKVEKCEPRVWINPHFFRETQYLKKVTLGQREHDR